MNDEWLWYVHELRSASLEALASCVYSLKDGDKLDVLKPLVNAMLRVSCNSRHLARWQLALALSLSRGDLKAERLWLWGVQVVEAVSESPMLAYGGLQDVKQAIELAG